MSNVKIITIFTKCTGRTQHYKLWPSLKFSWSIIFKRYDKKAQHSLLVQGMTWSDMFQVNYGQKFKSHQGKR